MTAQRTAGGRVIEGAQPPARLDKGLGGRSDAQIIWAFWEGVGKTGRTMNPVMPYGSAFHVLTDEDAHAIVRYLRSIPPVRNPLPRNADWQPSAQ